MNNYRRLFIAAVLTMFSSSVVAEALSYTFASISYVKYSTKLDGLTGEVNGDGYAVDLSYALRPHIAITAGYSASKADTIDAGEKIDADIDATSVGFLIHAAINDTSDFIVGASFINGKADVSREVSPDRSIDADGGVTIIGFRAMAGKELEINGFLQKFTIEESSMISFSFGADYYVDESVSLDLGYVIDSEDGSDLITFGVTKYF